MTESWLVTNIACLLLANFASAMEDQEIHQGALRGKSVYGINLSQHRGPKGPAEQSDLNGTAKGWRVNLYRSVEYLRAEGPLLVGGGTVLLLILVNYLAVTRAYHGRATYFADYGDVFWFCLPVTVIVLTKGFVWWAYGDVRLGGQVVKVCLAFACVYNLIRPFIDNRRAPLLLAVSVCISRFTLGYLLILAITCTLMGMHPAKRTDETDEVYELRRQTAMIEGSAALAGIGVLIRSLVGRAEDCDRW